ncbi:MAG: hypothetical protein PHF86_06865 [Candidatus Nanoarchaeia archaeon]|nr:hypothetical protein [Candidatus Nanoarchaeia archaeon]
MILNPLVTLWNSFVSMLPGLLAAIIVLIVGYFVAFLLGHGLKLLLEKLGLNKWIYQSVISKAIGHTNVSSFLGEILKWYIFIVFLQVAVDLLQLGTLSALLSTFVMWLPNVIAAVIIVFVGVALAHYIEMRIKSHTKMKGMNISALLAKVVIFFVVAIVALEQIGINVSILENTFLIIIAALGLGIAIAIGIGFGSGLKGSSQKFINNLKKM